MNQENTREPLEQAKDALEWMLDAFGDRSKPPKAMLAMAAVHKARSALSEVERALQGKNQQEKSRG